RVRLMVNGSLRATYTVILFGDVNGDGNIDDGDGSLIVDVENHILNWNASPDKRYASDLNADGAIDSSDAAFVTEVMNYVQAIDQTNGAMITILD
ncbi:MAG TPA: dockerin type I domain-containing protein, partial [Clostridiales bacterium]|nr:dockerin type I domain-containing protein [Clostridiales bacterium]